LTSDLWWHWGHFNGHSRVPQSLSFKTKKNSSHLDYLYQSYDHSNTLKSKKSTKKLIFSPPYSHPLRGLGDETHTPRIITNRDLSYYGITLVTFKNFFWNGRLGVQFHLELLARDKGFFFNAPETNRRFDYGFDSGALARF